MKIHRFTKGATPLVDHVLRLTEKTVSGLMSAYAAFIISTKILSGLVCRQWLGIGALLAGVGLLGATLFIKFLDAPAIENINPRAVEEFGIYSDGLGFDSFIQYPEGMERSLGDWSVEATPGDPWRVTVTWLRLEDEDFPIDVVESKSVLIALPQGARLVEGVTLMETEGDKCAAWHTEKGNGSVAPELIVSADNRTWAICTIPSVGPVQSLASQMTFEWDSPVRGPSGIGRVRDAISFPSFAWGTSYISRELPDDVSLPSPAVLQPLTFTINSESDQKIIEAFPQPEDGGVGKRSWNFSYESSSPEIEFVIQSESDRIWINPATDVLLLLGGTALGLVTAFWRKNPR